MHKPSNKSMYFIVLILFIGGISYLIYTGFSEDSVYFLTVNEALAVPKDKLKAARLFGVVSEENFTFSDDRRSVHFKLKDRSDPSQIFFVDYIGIVPDTFQPNSEVIVEGSLNPNGIFQAKTLMTKCPSRYEKET